MTSFPRLRSGAIAQYPATKELRRRTQVLRFLDGSEQRHRIQGRPLRRWLLRLDWLTETELASVQQFFIDQGGQAGTFAFTDPWDGTVYPDCSLDQDQLVVQWLAVGRGAATVTIRENGS